MTKQVKAKMKMFNQKPDVVRVPSGLYSWDHVMGGGFVPQSIVELAGWRGSGKSTMALYLSAQFNPERVVMCDTENAFDERYARIVMENADYGGEFYNVDYVAGKGKKADAITDEKRMDMMFDLFDAPKGSSVGILDSVGGIVPVAEAEGEMTDALMGLRARIMAKFMRRSSFRLRYRPRPSQMFVVNHLQPIIGMQGAKSIGGSTIEYLSSYQVRLAAADTEDDGSMMIKADFRKVKYKGVDYDSKYAQCYFLAGYGIHRGLSAVMDCIIYRLASKENGVITMGSKSYGRFSTLRSKADDESLFAPFHAALKKQGG